MDHLVNAVRAAVQQRNYYAALTVALVLPEVCGRLAHPGMKSKARFIAWWQAHMVPSHTMDIGPAKQPHVFLSAEDAYAFRCAALHEASDEISTVDEVRLNKFDFVVAPPGMVVHMNQFEQRLQLQVDVFCEEICCAVEQWLAEHGETPAVVSAMEKHMRIQTIGGAWTWPGPQ